MAFQSTLAVLPPDIIGVVEIMAVRQSIIHSNIRGIFDPIPFFRVLTSSDLHAQSWSINPKGSHIQSPTYLKNHNHASVHKSCKQAA